MKPIYVLKCNNYLFGNVLIKLVLTTKCNFITYLNLVFGHPSLKLPFTHAQLSHLYTETPFVSVHILFYYNRSIHSLQT